MTTRFEIRSERWHLKHYVRGLCLMRIGPCAIREVAPDVHSCYAYKAMRPAPYGRWAGDGCPGKALSPALSCGLASTIAREGGVSPAQKGHKPPPPTLASAHGASSRSQMCVRSL